MSCVDGSRIVRGNLPVWRLVGCRLVSGLSVRFLVTAGLMVFADKVPFYFSSRDALDIRRVVLILGLTGSASHRPCNP